MTPPHAPGNGRGNHLLDAALALAARGWPVVPLHDVEGGACSCGDPRCKKSAGKHPRTEHGLKDGTTDPAAIRGWWRRWPPANVAVCTGPAAGVFVLGPDGQAGLEALAELQRRHGPLPRTPTAQSGGGGKHYYFRWPAADDVGNRRNHRGLPIDVRGRGGYAVAPPSRNAEGPYVWEVPPWDCEPAEAPAWLLEWCRSDAQADPAAFGDVDHWQATCRPKKGPAAGGLSITDRAIHYLTEVAEAVSGAGGHDKTLWAARAVVWGFDLGPEAGYQLLAAHYNPRCDPPWSEKELRHKCAEAATVPFGKPRGWLLEEGRPAPRRPTAKPRPAAVRPLPAYRPFPLDALPVLLRDYVGASASAIGCDPALVALPALAVAAGCIGNSRALRLKRGWAEPPIVWAVTVAPSGSQKSPAYAAAVDPLLAIQLDLADRHQQDRDGYERELRQRQALRREDRGPEPEEPPAPPCHVTSDATIEAVGELLRDNPRGLLLARDELDGWFQGFTRYKQGGATDRPHWVELNRAGTLCLHRTTRGPLSVRRACCSVTGTIQPAVLAAALDQLALAAGLGARFLLAMPPRRLKRWTEAEVCEDLAGGYEHLLRGLLALPLADGAKRRPHFLTLAPPAKLAFVGWYDGWCRRQFDSQDEQAAVLAKLEGYAPRLALVHHVIAHRAVDSDDLRPVGEASVRAGIDLAEWFAAEALRVYPVLRETAAESEQRRLVEWVAARGGEVTARELQDSLRARYGTTEEAKAALDALADAGLGVWVERPPGPRGGRPTQVFRLSGARARETGETPSGGQAGGPGGAGETPGETPSDPTILQETGGFAGFAGAGPTNGAAPETGEVSRPPEVLRAPGGGVWVAPDADPSCLRTPFDDDPPCPPEE